MKKSKSFIQIGILGLALWLAAAPSRGQPAPSQQGSPPPASAPTTQATAPSSQPTTSPAATQPTTAPALEAGEKIPLSMNNMPLDQVAKFISEKTGKPVIPAESVKSKQITIASSKTMTVREALALVAEALRQNGVIMEEGPGAINLRALAEVKQTRLRVVGPQESLAAIEDKGLIVEKVFALKYYDPSKIKDVIVPMLPAWGHLTADSASRTLIVADSVANLERIEQIITTLDTPVSTHMQPRVFQITQGDAREILPILSALISGLLGKPTKEAVTTVTGTAAPSAPAAPGGPARTGQRQTSGASGQRTQSTGGGRTPGAPSATGGAAAATVVFIEEAKTPVVLMAEASRNWIIAVAPPEILDQIAEWIAKLDQPSRVEKVFDIYPVEKGDIDEVSRQLSDSIEALPDPDVRASIRIVPFVQARKLLVFGTQRGREIVRDILSKLDVDASEFRQVQTFELKYADAEDVAKKIETLFSGRVVTSESSWYRAYSPDTAALRVKIVPDTRRNAVTVITDAPTMEKIRDLIVHEWDLPISGEDVEPRVFTLQHADPVQVKTLLEEMFSQKGEQGVSFYDYLFGRQSSATAVPVGRLYGQFSFQAMPNSNKLIVTTKNPANYEVIGRLIEKLDQPQEAGLPKIFELKHANAEDLAEQLNSLLAEPGTLAEILRSQRDLRAISRSTVVSGDTTTAQDANATSTTTSTMRFWWQVSRPRTDEQPTSNMIGRIRFVPVNRRNALMVLAPQAYVAEIEKLITELDKPGMQVLIHAIVAEVQHDDTTTLGLRIAADDSLLSDPRLTDTAIGGGFSATRNDLFGGTFAIGDQTFGRLVLQTNINVSFLIQLLMKKYNMQVLFEPKLYTSDNQQSDFFDGQDVPILTESRTSAEGTSTVSNVTYVAIGANLSVRPHITQEGGVDLSINLAISRIVPGESLQGNVVFDRRETTTHVIVQDGQTVMLSGIVHQEEFDEVRKAPILGDIPLIGLLFRNVNKAKRNRELVAFITPHVIGSPQQAQEKMGSEIRTMEEMRNKMRTTQPGQDEPPRLELPPASGEPPPPDSDPPPRRLEAPPPVDADEPNAAQAPPAGDPIPPKPQQRENRRGPPA
ncbi:MAG: hypothetical protein MUP47_01985 [Phycisphaerae bacterium]|nr:hypothetical protein [Phycisphaerae bacterium]